MANQSEPTKPLYPEPEHFPEAEDALAEPEPAAPTAAQPAVQPALYVQPEPEIVPHLEHSYTPSRFVCVRCGSKNLAKGMIIDYSDRFDQVRFAPRRININWLNSLFNLRPWRGLLKLEAVACRDCGAVLMTIDPDELRRAERKRDL